MPSPSHRPLPLQGCRGPPAQAARGETSRLAAKAGGSSQGGPSSPASTLLIPQLLTPAVWAVGAGRAAKHQPVHTQPLEKVGVLLPPGEGEIQHSVPCHPLCPHGPVPRLTHGTTTVPRAPHSAPAVDGRRSPRGHRHPPAPPADGSHCRNTSQCGMSSRAAGLPQPLVGVTYLCWYLDSFSSSQAVLPPPKPSCSVRSRPWVHGGVAVQAWDSLNSTSTHKVPPDTSLPGTCHPLPSPEPSHCAPGNAVGVPPLHHCPSQATPLPGPVTTLTHPACDASGPPTHITPPRTPFVPTHCHLQAVSPMSATRGSPWSLSPRPQLPPPPSSGCVTPQPSVPFPPVCLLAAAPIIPMPPRPAPC